MARVSSLMAATFPNIRRACVLRVARIHAFVDERLPPQLDVELDLVTKIVVQPVAAQRGGGTTEAGSHGFP